MEAARSALIPLLAAGSVLACQTAPAPVVPSLPESALEAPDLRGEAPGGALDVTGDWTLALEYVAIQEAEAAPQLNIRVSGQGDVTGSAATLAVLSLTLALTPDTPRLRATIEERVRRRVAGLLHGARGTRNGFIAEGGAQVIYRRGNAVTVWAEELSAGVLSPGWKQASRLRLRLSRRR